MKTTENDNVKLESEISNYRSNIEIRTSELIRQKQLKAEESRLSSTASNGVDKQQNSDRFSGGSMQPTMVQSQAPRVTASASIFTQDYGASTVTDKPLKKATPVTDTSMSQPSQKGRGSTTGPKVKSTGSYCNLI